MRGARADGREAYIYMRTEFEGECLCLFGHDRLETESFSET